VVPPGDDLEDDNDLEMKVEVDKVEDELSTMASCKGKIQCL
jgi:hypothetical protein